MFITRGSTQIPTRFASGSLICSNVAITVQVSKHGSKVVRLDCCIRKLSANTSLSVNRYSTLVSLSSPNSLIDEIVNYYNRILYNLSIFEKFFLQRFFKSLLLLVKDSLVFVRSNNNVDHCIFLLAIHCN